MQSGFKSLLLASALATAGFTALAQPAGYEGGPMGMHGRMDPAKMEAMMAKRHDAIKAKLKLTSEQEGAWAAFTAAMKPPARADMKRPDRAEMDKLTTPERIDKMRAQRSERMTAMSAAMDKREDAIKTFYATLNADQKKVFDTEHARMDMRQGQHRGPGGGKGADKPVSN